MWLTLWSICQVSPPHHLGLKQSAIVSLGDRLWLTTGFSKTRERWFLVFDSSTDLARPISTSRIDFETAPLWPVVDVSRKIVYLAGKVGRDFPDISRVGTLD